MKTKRYTMMSLNYSCNSLCCRVHLSFIQTTFYMDDVGHEWYIISSHSSKCWDMTHSTPGRFALAFGPNQFYSANIFSIHEYWISEFEFWMFIYVGSSHQHENVGFIEKNKSSEFFFPESRSCLDRKGAGIPWADERGFQACCINFFKVVYFFG